MILFSVSSALAADGACPSGSNSIFYCASGDSYTQLCAGPGAERATTLRLVVGAPNRPPELVHPADGALSAFTVHTDGEVGTDGSRHLVIAAGDRSWHIEESWHNGIGAIPYAHVTATRGGAWVSRASCLSMSPVTLPESIHDDPALIAPAPSPPKVASQCVSGQRSLFTCAIDRKVVSICATPATGALSGLQYRFGPLGAPELVYPATPSLDAFRIEASTSGNGHNVYGALTFDREGYTYKLGSSLPDTGNGDPPSGKVEVSKGGKVVATLPCTHGITSDLPQTLRDMQGH